MRAVSPVTARILLWLFVINLGIAFGAGLYESQVVVPQWFTIAPTSEYRWNAAAARGANTGLRFWVYVTTVPLTLLSVANLYAGWRAVGAMRRWWVAAAVVALLDRLITFSYFIPTMLQLMSEQASSSAATAMALQWVRLNYLRHAIVLVAWLAALKTLSMLHQSR